MEPADIVALIDEWNPRVPELQESRDGMYIDNTHHNFVEKLVIRLNRLDLDSLSVEGDDRFALEEAIELCGSALQSWNADPSSLKKIVGDNNEVRNNPVVVIRRLLSEAQVLEGHSSDGPPYDRVFISHAASERSLAECLGDEIAARLPDTSIFIASRPDAIPAGVWFDTIQEELGSADAYVSIITPMSKDRHWVIWEHGASAMSGKPLITTRAGISNHEIPEPFKLFQIRSLEDPEQAAEVFRELGDSGAELEAFCEKVGKEIMALATASPTLQVPAPIEAYWAGGDNSWVNMTRRLEVHLVGEGPVKIVNIEAWMTHRDDPATQYPGEHRDRVPTALGGGKTTLDFTFRFFPDDIPEELRQKSKPNNLITMWARVHYVDRRGESGEFTAELLVT